MAKMIFVNLPVADLPAAIAFYEAIGGTKNSMFSDASGACIVFSETIYAMLLTHEKFRSFSPKTIVDAHVANEVLLCMSEESREAVDATLARALAAGGREPNAPDEYDFMYGRAFEDLDGHSWQVMWMDPAAATNGPPKAEAEAEAEAHPS